MTDGSRSRGELVKDVSDALAVVIVLLRRLGVKESAIPQMLEHLATGILLQESGSA